MNLVLDFAKIEIFKIFARRSQFFLLILTTIGYPFLMAVFITLSFQETKFDGGLPLEDVTSGVITLTNSFILLPLWITIFVGQEFSMNYVTRFVLTHSRKRYFFSKVIYCFIVSSYFTFLTFITIYISFGTILHHGLVEYNLFFVKLVPQLWIVYTLSALLSLGVVFLIRTPTLSTVLLYILPQIDNIIFFVGSKIYDLEIRIGPFEAVRTLYSKSISPVSFSYSNFFSSNFLSVVWPISYVLIILFLSYRNFLHRDLKMMSE